MKQNLIYDNETMTVAKFVLEILTFERVHNLVHV